MALLYNEEIFGKKTAPSKRKWQMNLKLREFLKGYLFLSLLDTGPEAPWTQLGRNPFVVALYVLKKR